MSYVRFANIAAWGFQCSIMYCILGIWAHWSMYAILWAEIIPEVMCIGIYHWGFMQLSLSLHIDWVTFTTSWHLFPSCHWQIQFLNPTVCCITDVVLWDWLDIYTSLRVFLGRCVPTCGCASGFTFVLALLPMFWDWVHFECQSFSPTVCRDALIVGRSDMYALLWSLSWQIFCIRICEFLFWLALVVVVAMAIVIMLRNLRLMYATLWFVVPHLCIGITCSSCIIFAGCGLLLQLFCALRFVLSYVHIQEFESICRLMFTTMVLLHHHFEWFIASTLGSLLELLVLYAIDILLIIWCCG